MLNEKVIILITAGLMKNIVMSYFPEPYTCSKNKIKVELDLANYAKKSDKMHQVVIHQILLKMLI